MDVEEDNSQDLLRMKGKGFNRKCPQADAVPRKNISVHNTTDWNCKECDFKGASAAHLRKHVTFRHSQNLKNNQTEQEFNCQDCDFQGSSEMQLKKHITLKHMQQKKDNNSDGSIQCRNCEEIFTEKWKLMKHRKTNHPATVAVCRKFTDGACNFTAESCWWNHFEKENINGRTQCFICDNTFESNSDMMGHRKKATFKHCSTMQSIY